MAKLVDVYDNVKAPVIKRRQLPLNIYENLTMVMDLNAMGLICDNPQVQGREYEVFARKYKTLTIDELKTALRVDASDIFNVLNQSIPCIGCRRSVERLFSQLCNSKHPTLDPLLLSPDEIMTIRQDKIIHPQSLATLLNGHRTGLDYLVENQTRWKKSQRCSLHSLEVGGARSGVCGWAWGALSAWGWGGRVPWRVAWDSMHAPAREHVTLIHYDTLHDTLQNYLKKHRFCAECKTKVLRAYQLLVEEKEPHKEKGYVGSLYSGIKRCLLERHLHLHTKTDFINQLITRAEPELLGNHRERHAKTLEIAQEEVLICLALCVFERLQRISIKLKEEETTCQMLAAVGVEALYRKFETAVEIKTGVSKLQILYDEITQEEINKQQRKQQKKLKRRKKKERQAHERKCKEVDSEEQECLPECTCKDCLQGREEREDVPNNSLTPRDYSLCYEPSDCGDTCQSCQGDLKKRRSPKKKSKKRPKKGCPSPNDHSQDGGYSSGNNGGCCENSSGSSSIAGSPEGSEVACSEGFCNHERGDCLELAKPESNPSSGFTYTLEDMLTDTSCDDQLDKSYIPIEEVLEFKSRRNISQERQELRLMLRQKFKQLCVNNSPNSSKENK